MLCNFCNSQDNTAKDLFCKSCSKIIDKTSLNAFEIFAVDKQFIINKTQLQKRLLELQSAYHPDKFIKKEDEQELSTNNSAHINQCYKILRNNIKRAELLLNLQNIKTEGEKVTDMEFLAQSFEWREGGMDDEVEADYAQALKQFAQMYKQSDFEGAKDIFLKLKFYKRYLDEVEDSKTF